jgi:hypothetical protein
MIAGARMALLESRPHVAVRKGPGKRNEWLDLPVSISSILIRS